MKKILLSIICIAGISTVSSAQLYDQTTSESTSGIVSNYYTDLDTLVQCADDFVVPAGFNWDVTSVTVHGFRSVGGPGNSMDSMGVELYSNNGGQPGTVLYSGVIQIGGAGIPSPVGDTMVTLTIPMQNLASGTYWVSVYGFADNGPSNGERWNWTGNTAVVGFNGFLLDVDNLFGVGATNWTDVVPLVGGDPDFAFAIGGTSNTNGGASITEEMIELDIFPNPVVDFVQINAGGLVIEQATVYSVNGQIIQTNVNPNENKIDVTDLPSGTYILEVITSNGAGQTRFIK
jgi:Secretion system C-terminal sorting domain